MQVIAQQNDTVDALCNRVYGTTTGMSELVYNANQGLAELGLTLPIGTVVEMPDKPVVNTTQHVVNLWD